MTIKLKESNNRGRALTAIVKPTHDCNLACKYCYVPDGDKEYMDEETLVNAIRKVILFNGKERMSYFIWHGGEPLLASLEFYRKVVKTQAKFKIEGYRIRNSIQTNGTLLNGTLLDYLRQNDFRLGLSLDGPQDIHDATRPYKDGHGSFADVFEAVQLIKGRGIKPSAICVLSKFNEARIGDLYRFFNTNRIHLKLNPVIAQGRGKTNRDELAVSSREYGEALIKLFDIWFYDQNQHIKIEPLSSIMGNLITNKPHGCNFSGCQRDYISIGPSGDIYPCSRFDGFQDFYLGNINKNRMEEVYSHPLREKLNVRGRETIRACQACEFGNICNSGCMANAFTMLGNALERDYYCTANKMIFKHISNALHKELLKAEELTLRKDENMKLKGYDVNLKYLKPALRRELDERIKLQELSREAGWSGDWYDAYWTDYSDAGCYDGTS